MRTDRSMPAYAQTKACMHMHTCTYTHKHNISSTYNVPSRKYIILDNSILNNVSWIFNMGV